MTKTILSVIFTLTLINSLFAQLKFDLVTGEKTGTAKLMSDWRTAELKRWEGKKVSHQWWPWGLGAFDYDNDGDLDLIISHHGRPTSKIFKNQLVETKKLTFIDVTAELGLNHKNAPHGDDRPWMWDFDGDGYLDIGTFTDEGQTPILFNKAGKKFEAGHTSFTAGALAHPEELLDLNGDGYLDLDGGYKGLFYYNPKAKKFDHEKKKRFDDPAGLVDHLKDFTNKHKAATKGTKIHNRFFRSKPATHFLNGYDTIGFEPDQIDINNDGIGDIIIAGSGGYGGSYLGRYAIGSKDGKYTDFSENTKLPLDGGCPIYWGDLDGNGASDIMLAGKNGGIFLNDGKGIFTRKTSDIEAFLKRRGPYLLRAFRADFDNDGDFDFVMTNPRRTKAEFYENKGNGEFKKYNSLGSWDNNSVVICDIDNDGLLDVLLGAPGGHKSTDIHFYLNKTNSVNKSIRIKTRMGKPNINAVSSTVKIKSGDKVLLHTKPPMDGQAISFGHGKSGKVDVEISFPNGKKVIKQGLVTGKLHTIFDNGNVETN